MPESEHGFRQTTCPVEEGKVYEAKIEDVGCEGDGPAKIQNFVVFIPGAKVGIQVKVRIARILRCMAFGEVVKEYIGQSRGTPSRMCSESHRSIYRLSSDLERSSYVDRVSF